MVFDMNEEIRPGILEFIHVKNFMCHENYKIEFGVHVNIVLGRNGSGKSSLLAAVLVALGGKASHSGKAVVLKNLVQHGKPFAEVAIKLKNSDGPDGFEFDKYGDHIIVERRIDKEGGASYKLKSSHGVVVSTKRDDLNAILSTFNIQVNNPVAVLTQEMSKIFLNSKDDKDKYMFFFQATQLENVQSTYSSVANHLKQAQTIVSCKETVLASLKSSIAGLEKEIQNYRSLDEKRAQLSKLHHEFSWALVHEKEKLIEKLQELLQQRKGNAEKCEKKCNEMQTQCDSAAKKANEIAAVASQLNQDINALQAKGQQLWDNVIKLQTKIREKQGNISVCDRDITLDNQRIATAELRLSLLKLQSQEHLEKQNTEIQKGVMDCKRKIEVYTKQMNEVQKKLECSKKESDNRQQEIQQEKEHCQEIEKQLTSAEKDINKLQLIKCNHQVAFGRRIPDLLMHIKHAVEKGQFRKPPIGPVGLYVKVKERKWALAVEQCLSISLLKGFLCDNLADLETLQGIMLKLYGDSPIPQITASPFINQVHDVRDRKVRSEKYACVMDMVDVPNPVVMNYLIDQRGIENTLLIPVAAEARDVMMNPPPNCNDVYTVKGNLVCAYPLFRFYSCRKRSATLINAAMNLDEDIKAKMAECNGLRDSLKNHQEKKNTLESQWSLLQKVIRDQEKQVIEYGTLINREYSEIKQMESIEYQDSSNIEELALNEMRTTLESKLQRKTVLQAELADLEEQFKRYEEDGKSTKRELFTKNTNLEAHVQKQLTLSHQRTSRLSKRLTEMKMSYDKLMEKVKEVEDEYQKQLCLLHEQTALAETVCSRINTTAKPGAIEASIDEVKAIIREADKNSQNIREIVDTYTKQKSREDQTNQEIKHLLVVIKHLKHTMEMRMKQFENIRYCMCLRINNLFLSSLQGAFFGRLHFDHENKRLKINVRGGRNRYEARASKSLSGGEKSFVTVALLLALWDAVDLPFRIMDEYDVYMDQVNRKKSMDLMLSTALSRSNSQFIFFTPQLLTSFKESNKIRVLQLPEPERKSLKRKHP